MKKRWTAALLAFLLAAALLPAPARAASAADGSAGGRLTGTEREIYEYLKSEVSKVTKGTRTSTSFTISNPSGLSWTLKDLGITKNSGENVLDKLEEAFLQAADIGRVYDCLTADCPYELFWRGSQLSWGYNSSRDESRVVVNSLTVRIEVSQDYQGGGAYSTNPSKISAASEAAEKARDIVDRHRDESDYEKLISYREEICALTSYNSAAAADESMPYGDPWQIIYVFDGDPDTNVVCEGYAKAFKYLCDLSQFNGGVVCRTVTGTMNGGSHMWNVVQMGDGKQYLVDVTNCDSGTIGADDKLFLTGASALENGRTYAVSKEKCQAVYTYDEDQAGLYTDGWLALSESDYVDMPGVTIVVGPSETEEPNAPAVIPFSDVPEGEWYAEAVDWAVENRITNGTSDGADGQPRTFSPSQTCTQAQILTFLYRAADRGMGEAAADDMDKAVSWARKKGMIGDGFDGDTPCTRSAAVHYIWQALGSQKSEPASFDDVDADADYAAAVAWAVASGVTNGNGSDTTFSPDEVCSRGHIVTFLYRAYH